MPVRATTSRPDWARPTAVLLARALTTIAHSQMSFSSSPEMLHADGSGDWTSGTDQSLMFQAISNKAGVVGVALDDGHLTFQSTASAAYAWTAQLAEQVLQPDFDPNLVRLFDKQAQGWVEQSVVAAGDDLAVSLNAKAMQAGQGTMTSSFGFADFMSDQGVVRVARPVAVAETARPCRRHDRHRACPAERRGQAVGELLQGRRLRWHDQGRAARAGRLRGPGGGARLTSSRQATRRSLVLATATMPRPACGTSMPAT